jgi:hypothetical protein
MNEKERKSIEKIIIQELLGRYSFIEREDKSITVDPLKEAGLLWNSFLLSDIRDWIGKDAQSDGPLLDILDSLVQKGKLLIFRAEIRREDHFNDIHFVSEVGKGFRQWNDNCREVVPVRLYSERPLTKKEREKPFAILNIRERVEQIRKRRDEHFQRRFGISNEAELLRKFHREDIEDDVRLKSAVHKIANSINKVDAKAEK